PVTASQTRGYLNGRTAASQAAHGGSIPLTRSFTYKNWLRNALINPQVRTKSQNKSAEIYSCPSMSRTLASPFAKDVFKRLFLQPFFPALQIHCGARLRKRF